MSLYVTIYVTEFRDLRPSDFATIGWDGRGKRIRREDSNLRPPGPELAMPLRINDL